MQYKYIIYWNTLSILRNRSYFIYTINFTSLCIYTIASIESINLFASNLSRTRQYSSYNTTKLAIFILQHVWQYKSKETLYRLSAAKFFSKFISDQLRTKDMPPFHSNIFCSSKCWTMDDSGNSIIYLYVRVLSGKREVLESKENKMSA